MMRTTGLLFFLAASLLFLSVPALADGGPTCHREPIAQLDMTPDADGHVSVPMTVDGRPVNLLVDTGGTVSTLTADTAAVLGLAVVKGFGTMRFYGGVTFDQLALVHHVLLGDATDPKLAFYITSNRGLSAGENGIMAPDILSQFDVDLDFANAKFRLYPQDHCDGPFVPWAQGNATRTEIAFDSDHHILVPLVLDGKQITAILDTGAPQTVGSLDDIEQIFGIGHVPASNDRINVYSYPFKTLSFAGVVIHNPQIRLRPDSESHTRHTFLIGLNMLRDFHLYIAYKEGALYVAPATAH